MNQETTQLTEAFAAHEHLAPDAALVLAKANGIARSMQRRRWAVRATGGAALGVGLVASGIALPGAFGHANSNQTVRTIQPADSPSPSPSASPATYTADQEWNAYFEAGYRYDDAQQLATLWHDNDNIGTIKAAAGLKLLDGEKLPIPPSGTPETPVEKAQTAYFGAGYDYNDAVTLGQMWHETNIQHVKTKAGQELLDGQTLPIKPSDPSVPGTLTGTSASGLGSGAAGDASALAAYFAAGYDYNDAVALGKVWHQTDTDQIKAAAGQKLLDGQQLPIAP
jgi:hypothetical protein